MIGSTISRYQLIEPHAGPGLGESYLARDTAEGRLVTLRLLPDPLARDPEALRRAFEEARTVCSPSHPHICTVHDAGLHEGRPYLVTEVTEGTLLSALVERGPIDIQVLLDFGVQISDALAKAHDRGITHGALGLDSILVMEGEQIRVMDFGVARIARGTAPATPAEDIAALGRLLRAMASGGGEAAGKGDDLPPLLRPIVSRALAGGQEAFRSVAEIAADLTRAMTDAGPTYVPPPPAPPDTAGAGAASRRRRAGWLAIAGVLLAAIVVGFLTCS